MRPRGVTLVELLIVVALLLGVGAIVAPSLSHHAAERSFEAMTADVRSFLLSARIEAMTFRLAVEVRFEPDPPRMEVLRFDPLPDSLVRTSDGDAVSIEGDGFTLDLDSSLDVDGHELIAPKRVFDLHAGISIRATRPPAGGNADDAANGDDDETAARRRIAVFLPDGSVLLAPESWITDDDARMARLSFNPWTGIASVERVVVPADEEVAAEDAAAEDEAFEIAGNETDRRGAPDEAHEEGGR